MDELVIDGETYISTKRAAKLTGYAKDYVGQLCREGRVPARLVGRSWYVLGSAIHEHRFGGATGKADGVTHGVVASPAPVVNTESAGHELPSLAWEPARYAAIPNTLLPNINRLREPQHSGDETVPLAELPPAPEATPESPGIHDVWSEWFQQAQDSRVTAITAAPPVSEEDETSQSDVGTGGVSEQQSPDISPTNDEVEIPIHAIPEEYTATLPREVVPESFNRTQENRAPLNSAHPRRRSYRLSRYVAMIAVIMATGAVFLASANAGVLDKWQIASGRALPFSGIFITK